MTSDQKKALASSFYAWWAKLHDPNNDGKNANRADRAKLRRIDLIHNGEGLSPDTAHAMTIEAYRELHQKVTAVLGALDDDQEADLVTVAVTLAQIRQNDTEHKSTATALGGKEDADRVMKETRFLRLMRATSAADLFDQSRRLAAILKTKAPIQDLAVSLFLWRDDPKIRRDWARAYYHLDQFGFETNATSSDNTLTEA